jgi:hypothetical protein
MPCWWIRLTWTWANQAKQELGFGACFDLEENPHSLCPTPLPKN